MTAEHHVAEPAPSRPGGRPLHRRTGNAAILGALWVVVIVLAVIVDLAK